MTDAFFYSLWRPMFSFALNGGVDQDDAKDVVMEAIYKVIDHYSPERGPILPFAFTVLKNGMRNYYRHHNKTIPLAWDIEMNAPTPLDDAIRVEQEHHAKSVLSVLKQKLAPKEISLLEILQVQLEKEGEYNVSEAARTLGIEPLKAFDLLRKIKRRLSPLMSVDMFIAESRAEYPAEPEQKIPTDVMYSMIIRHEDDIDAILQQIEGFGIYLRISEYLKKSRS